MAPIIVYLITEQFALSLAHDSAATIARLTSIKSGLDSNIAELVQLSSSLDPNSPEAKSIETRRQHLANLEKKLDADLTYYRHKLQKAEALKKWAEEGANKNIAA